jgi:creatinine amidohydrolase
MPNLLAVVTLGALLAVGQTPPPRPSAGNPDPNMSRPIAARDSVFLAELTWLEVRDAMRAGKTTVIVATGGIEQNGPYLALDKHQVVLRATTEAIARKLGNALVAPIVAFVPEGNIDPPSGHMRFPGTITLTDETYKRLLTDIAASLRAHGFTNIVFIGDSGGNQEGMKEVASTLNAAWTDGKTRVHFIPEYYDYPGVQKWLESQGVKQTNEGHHDDFQITAEMMVVDPTTVRLQERIAAGKASINGVPIAPAEKAIEWGKKIVDYRAEITVKAIREKLAQVRTSKSEG